MLNQDVREKLADLTAAGHSADKTDIIISLFQAYNTTTNEDFRGAITYWKNKWNSKVWTTPDELMQRADSKYMELKNMGTWGKRAAKDDQFVALTNKIDKLTKQKANKGNTSNSENKSAPPKWKYDRSLSNGKHSNETIKHITGVKALDMEATECGSCTNQEPAQEVAKTKTNQRKRN